MFQRRADHLAKPRYLCVIARDDVLEAGTSGQTFGPKHQISRQKIGVVARQVQAHVEGFVVAMHFVGVIALFGEGT